MSSGYGIGSLILLAIYLVYLLGIGYRLFSRNRDSAEEYLLMGRRLTLPAFIASAVSTWYGGILGVGEYSFKHGISNWLVFGLPYYLAALLFAIFLAGRARQSGHYTIPDQLALVYGRPAAVSGAVLVFINAAPAAYILQIGVLAQYVFGMPLAVGVAAGALFSIVYVYSGGLRGDVYSDILQFFLMFAGFAVMLIFLVSEFGGTGFLQSKLPATSFNWRGDRPATYIFAWYFIALSALVEPSLYQRCFAARDERTARRGLLLSIPLWAVFDFMTTFTGMYARALLPDLADPMMSYPALAAMVLPEIFKGVFLVGLFATIMSTVDSYTFVSGTTIGKDIILRLHKKMPESKTITLYSRLGLIFSAAMAVLIALLLRSVIDIWYIFGTLSTCALLLPVASSFSPSWRMTSRGATTAIAASGLTVIGWFLIGHFGEDYPGAIDPIYPGLVVSLLIYVLDRAIGRTGRTTNHGA
mgnify:CR=1 FL=1